MKNKYITISFILASIVAMQFISSAGVARPYWDDYPLKLAPGESKIVSLSLQNMPPPEQDLRFEATLESDIASLIDKDSEYFVPSGSNDIPVDIEVKVPETATLGQIYEVAVAFQEIASGEGGMVSFATGFVSKFPVEVVGFGESIKRTEIEETPKKPTNYLLWMLVAVLLGVGIALLIIKKSKKAKSKKANNF